MSQVEDEDGPTMGKMLYDVMFNEEGGARKCGADTYEGGESIVEGGPASESEKGRRCAGQMGVFHAHWSITFNCFHTSR